ncbi:hypothetical protein [Desulforhabdus sp. TSK]|uniref:hypothetical protein n=1 Tax=Desulforhabdus sp. TSK TaxID=2925014 RepID=UPI001FC8633F|nr:hypothetical protein [Desulforhabdus sp. TSK]
MVAFTHLDEDHYKGATEFFWFDHAKKYQGDNRVRIKVMWVPAAVITEEAVDKEEGRVIRQEARHRFKQGKGVRVFSRPERLKAWCEKNGISLKERLNIITDAGKIAPELKKDSDGIEFFVHSPFAKRMNGREVEDRNDDCLVMQAVFQVAGVETKMLLMSDVTHEIITDIVDVTKNKKDRPERLEWDIVKIPHHCSYLSIGPEKGNDKTEPVPDVAWLYENQGADRGILVATSDPIPAKGSKEDKDSYPPHRQAANYYKDIETQLNGEFMVTMQHPKKTAPKPLVIEIESTGATVKKQASTAAVAAMSAPALRAG